MGVYIQLIFDLTIVNERLYHCHSWLVRQYVVFFAFFILPYHGTASSMVPSRGGSRISGKGVQMYKGVGVRFAELHHNFLNIP